MPSVQRAHETFKDTDAVVLTISLDGGGMETLNAYLAKYGYTIPALLDAKMEVARAFGIRGIPATVALTERGLSLRMDMAHLILLAPTFDNISTRCWRNPASDAACDA